MLFVLCERHFLSINAFSTLRATFSLVKSIFAFARDLFGWYRRFRSVIVFSLGKHIFAFANVIFASQKRFRLCERRFRSVKAFSPSEAFETASHVFARGTRFRSVNSFWLGKLFFAFSLGKKLYRLSGAGFR